MQTNDVTISVIIPHYNDWERCAALTMALSDLMVGNEGLELIVVDNGSNVPLTLPSGSLAKLLVCEQPGSYAARNRGVAASKGDYLVFTDSDCSPHELWIQTLTNFYANEGNQNKIVAGHVIVVPLEEGKENIYEAYDCLLGLDQKKCVRRGYAITANLACSRKVFDQVNGFDASRFSGGDADFVRRAVKQGYDLVYLNEAVVYHPARNSYQELDKKSKRVIGGQIRKGRATTRLLYVLKNVLPPVFAIAMIVLKAGKLRVKLKALCVIFPLWFIRVNHTMRAVFAKSYIAR